MSYCWATVRTRASPGIGSMLLGLFDGSELKMIGGASAFTAARRIELLAELEPLRLGDDVVAEGEASRWRSAADRSWIPLRPERVLEVAYDQMEGERFRHAARFPALASGQGARRMHFRSVGGSGAIRLRGCSCRW